MPIESRQVGEDIFLRIQDWGTPGGGTGNPACIPSCMLTVTAPGTACEVGTSDWSGECVWNYDNPPSGTRPV